MIADSLHLVKGSDRKYILLFYQENKVFLRQTFKMHLISKMS